MIGVVGRRRGRLRLGVRHSEILRRSSEVWCRKGSLVGSREEKLMIFKGSAKIVLVPNVIVSQCSKYYIQDNVIVRLPRH
jgi:hypothetical protein